MGQIRYGISIKILREKVKRQLKEAGSDQAIEKLKNI